MKDLIVAVNCSVLFMAGTRGLERATSGLTFLIMNVSC
jgi:hypothetical protein